MTVVKILSNSSMHYVALVRSFWLAGASVIGRLAPLSFLFWKSTELSVVEYSTISAIFLWSTVVSSLVGGGISTVMVQKIARTTDIYTQGKIFIPFYAVLMVTSSILMVILIAFGDHIFISMYGSSVDSSLYMPAAIIGWIWPQVNYFSSALNGAHKTTAAASCIAISGVCQGFGMLAADVVYSGKPIAIAWGLVMGSVMAAILTMRITINSLSITHVIFDRSMLQLLRENKLPIVISTISTAAVMPIGFLAGSFISNSNNGAHELSQYFLLEQINQIVVYFPAILGQVLMPLISLRIHSIDDKSKIHAIHKGCKWIIITTVGVTIVAIIISFIVKPILHFANFTKLPEDAAWATTCMLYNAMLTLPLTVLGAIVIGAGHIKYGSLSNIFWGGGVLIFTGILFSHGNFGFQAARVIASILVLILGTSFLYFNYKPNSKKDS